MTPPGSWRAAKELAGSRSSLVLGLSGRLPEKPGTGSAPFNDPWQIRQTAKVRRKQFGEFPFFKAVEWRELTSLSRTAPKPGFDETSGFNC